MPSQQILHKHEWWVTVLKHAILVWRVSVELMARIIALGSLSESLCTNSYSKQFLQGLVHVQVPDFWSAVWFRFARVQTMTLLKDLQRQGAKTDYGRVRVDMESKKDLICNFVVPTQFDYLESRKGIRGHFKIGNLYQCKILVKERPFQDKPTA